ncbi:AMP-binding enzyme family protein, partial [Vibrio parahaemolyticus VP2007-007]
ERVANHFPTLRFVSRKMVNCSSKATLLLVI